jgi:hypothetical protein
MNRSEFHNHMASTFENCLEISKAKNADYAGEASPFQNFMQVENLGLCSVEQGIMVRLSDKFTRIANLLTREAQVKDEKISDSISDAINYLAILMAWLDHKQVSATKDPVRIKITPMVGGATLGGPYDG